MENDVEGRVPDTVSDEWNRSEHPAMTLSPVNDDAGTIVDLACEFVNDAALKLSGMHREDGVLVISVDTTATTLSEVNERYRLVAEGGSDVVFTRGVEGEIDWVSPSVHRILGRRQEDFVGLSLRDLIHPDDFAASELTTEPPTEVAGGSHRQNVRFATADGDFRWMSPTLGVIGDEEGSAIGAVVTLRDVQSEVEARKSLERTVIDLHAAQRMARLASWRLDPATDLVEW